MPRVTCPRCNCKPRVPQFILQATVCCPGYAVLHTCPTCHRLLESPARSAGSETTCPVCKRTLRVPKDVLLPEPPASPDKFWFGFYCPSCSGEVATREGDVGAYAVCPHCLVPLVVPHWGHYLEGAAPVPPHDPLDSLHASREVACPACQVRFPARSPACPVCGARLASP